MTEGHTERLEAALAGRYKIERKLGEGGMASVYLAEDLKHKRKVALKILRPELAAVIGAERFLSEIQTTANLQHPHILALFDSGSADGYLYYVMPYIDGETLREKLDRERQLGVEESVRVARDVADALDYAHRHGVIHRDIKPGNILLQDGRPVVADFGIALAVSAAGGGRMTETGLSLGTPHYMSPEQASADRDLSARSDVYSLGCVLYEMIAGQPPHTGPSAQSILVRILTEEPRSLTELRHTVPPNVAAAVTKSIEKLPADRFESAKAFRDALDDTGFTYQALPRATGATQTVASSPAAAAGSRRLAPSIHAAATALLALATLVLGWMALGSGGPSVPARGGVVSFVLADEVHPVAPPIVGSDGSIAWPRINAGLNLMRPGALAAEPLSGTEDAFFGAFSPDAEWLAFVQQVGQEGYALRRMPAGGGPVSTLWEAEDGYQAALGSMAWAEDGWIYLGTGAGLGRVPDTGGPLDTLLRVDAGQTLIFEPSVLPGGRGVLFTLAFGNANPNNRIILMDLATRDTTTLVRDGFSARWVSSGYVVYAHSAGALYAMPFDPRTLEATAAPVPVLDDVAVFGNMMGRYDVSRNGTLVYTQGATAGGGGLFTFSLVSAQGEVEPLRLEPTDHPDVGLSPDGSRIAYTREDNIWVYDLDRGTNRRLTQEGSGHHNPIWSPDGTEVVYTSTHEGDSNGGELYARRADGTGSARKIGGVPNTPDYATQWLADGTILMDSGGPQGADIYRISAAGDAPPEAVLEADWLEADGAVSPDGRWMIYNSAEDGGVDQLFLRRWPDLGGRTQLTSGSEPVIRQGAHAAVWAADSRTIYFRRGVRLWTITLSDASGSRFTTQDTGVDLPGPLWELHPDGRLLVSAAPGQGPASSDAGSPRLVVVSNWLTALEERLGAVN